MASQMQTFRFVLSASTILFLTACNSGFNATDQTTGAAPMNNAASTPIIGNNGSLLTSLVPTPPITGTTYYVSSAGNDSASGRSIATAWASISKVNGFVFRPGDGIFFEGGSTFTGCLAISSANLPGSNASSGLTIGSYGGGTAMIKADCSSAGISLTGVSGIEIINLTLRGSAAGTTSGIAISNGYGSTLAPATNLQIINNDIGGFFSKTPTGGTGEISIIGGAPISQIYIAKNLLHGLSGAKSPDNNGYTGNGWGMVTNVTIEKNQVFDIGGLAGGYNGCEGNGILISGTKNAVAQYNVVHDLSGNVTTCGGGAGVWAYQADGVVLQFNEAYRVQPANQVYSSGCDWDGFDLDAGVTNSTVQYNYAHDNWGAGFLSYISDIYNYDSAGKVTGVAAHWGGNTYRYNVGINNGTWGNGGYGEVSLGGSGSPADMPYYFYNNTLIATNANPMAQNPIIGTYESAAGGSFLNNMMEYNQPFAVIINTGSANQGFTFSNNDYFTNLVASAEVATALLDSANSRETMKTWAVSNLGDPTARFLDPMSITAAGAAVTCFASGTPQGPADLGNCLKQQAPALQNYSPLRGAGLDLTKAPYNFTLATTLNGYGNTVLQPPQDFFGHSLLPGGSANIGADGH